MTGEEFRRLSGQGPARNKYNAKRVVTDGGESFDSAGEQAHHATLLLRVRIGEIRDLRRQTVFRLESNGRPVVMGRTARRPEGRQVTYKADFDYVVVATGAHVIEDYKGYDTRESRLKRAVLETMGHLVTVVGL